MSVLEDLREEALGLLQSIEDNKEQLRFLKASLREIRIAIAIEEALVAGVTQDQISEIGKTFHEYWWDDAMYRVARGLKTQGEDVDAWLKLNEGRKS